MCDRLAFMEMTDAEKAAVIADYAWMSLQFADRRADERARAERYAQPLSPLVAAPVLPPVAHPLERAAASTLSPATAGPSRDAAADFIPLDRAVAGDPLSTATCSRQVTPSPADPAARGTYSEEIA